MEMPRRDSSSFRLSSTADATDLAWTRSLPRAHDALLGEPPDRRGSPPGPEPTPPEPPRPDADGEPVPSRAAAQSEAAPEPIKRAILTLVLAGAPVRDGEDALFSFDRRPRNHPALRGRAGRVSGAGPDAPVRATVALEPELRMLGANYRDGWHGIAPDAFSRGVLARTLTEKALRVAAPSMPPVRREAVAERLAYETAGPHWAFRALMGVRAAHGDVVAGRRPVDRMLLVGVAWLALDATLREAGTGALPGTHAADRARATRPARRAAAPIEAGAEVCDAFFAWLAAPGTYEAHPSYPDAFRTFLAESYGLGPVAARAAASRFVAHMERGTDALARSILAHGPGAPTPAP